MEFLMVAHKVHVGYYELNFTKYCFKSTVTIEIKIRKRLKKTLRGQCIKSTSDILILNIKQ